MRRRAALPFALCGTLLIAVLLIAGRWIYIGHHTTPYEKIAGRALPASLALSENDTALAPLTDELQIEAVTSLLRSFTYTEYPHFFHPDSNELTSNRLTVTFENGSSIGVDADGYVFIDGKLRDVESSRGQELYHKLYLLFHPDAV